MKDALDLASKSGIHRLITALEERGFIRRLPNRARALEVIRCPRRIRRASSRPRRLFAQRHRGLARQGRQGAADKDDGPRDDDADRDPGHGPHRRRRADLEAIQNRSPPSHVPPEMLSTGEHYALEVKGDSMIEAGILDGDLALIIRTAARCRYRRHHRRACRLTRKRR
jgi:repressor LexA